MNTDAAVQAGKPGDHPDHDVTIVIKSMRGTAKTFTFKNTTKVGEVIEVAVKAFEFAPGDKFELVFTDKLDEPLDHHRTLVSYQIKDGTELLLTSTGGGV